MPSEGLKKCLALNLGRCCKFPICVDLSMPGSNKLVDADGNETVLFCYENTSGQDQARWVMRQAGARENQEEPGGTMKGLGPGGTMESPKEPGWEEPRGVGEAAELGIVRPGSASK